MARFLMLLAGTVVSLLPLRYRRRWPLEDSDEFLAAAILSGVAQTMILLALLVGRLIDFFQGPTELGEIILNAPASQTIPVNGVGMLLFAEYLFDPLTVVFAYLTMEGIVRTFSAIGAEQKLATLPLGLIAALHSGVEYAWAKLKLGPKVVDDVAPGPLDGGHDLEVYSCRPKPDWNRYIAIEFEGEFYQLVRSRSVPPPRRFAFDLRRYPPGRLVLVVHPYAVDDVLKPARSGVASQTVGEGGS